MDRPTGIRLNDVDRANIEAIIASGAADGPTSAIRVGLAMAALLLGIGVRSRKLARKIADMLLAA